MFGKVIVFGLFEMIKIKIKIKMKSEDHVPGSGFGLSVRLGTTERAVTSLEDLLDY